MSRGSIPEKQGQETGPGFCMRLPSWAQASLHPSVRRQGLWVPFSLARGGAGSLFSLLQHQLWEGEGSGFFKSF